MKAKDQAPKELVLRYSSTSKALLVHGDRNVAIRVIHNVIKNPVRVCVTLESATDIYTSSTSRELATMKEEAASTMRLRAIVGI
jgi:hypothetical protein